MQSKLLRIKRIMLDYSQDTLAEVLGMACHTYNRKENGKEEFKQSEIKNMITALKLTPEEVVDIFFTDDVTNSLKESEI